MKLRTRTARCWSNPPGTKLVKRFIKASKREYPQYLDELRWLAPRDPLLARKGG
jgi:hypothetical protein